MKTTTQERINKACRDILDDPIPENVKMVLEQLLREQEDKKSNRLQEMQKTAKESVISPISRGCGSYGCNRNESNVACPRGSARGC